MKCKVCGNELIDGAKFCGDCGAKIEVEAHKVCVACGTPNKSGSAFCPSCGARMVEVEPVKETPVVKAEPAVKTAVEEVAEAAPVAELAPTVEEVVETEPVAEVSLAVEEEGIEEVVAAVEEETTASVAVQTKKDWSPTQKKYLHITSQSLLAFGSFLALIFLFFIGVTGLRPLDGESLELGLTQHRGMFSLFLDVEANAYTHQMLQTFAIILLMVGSIICMLVFFIIGTVKFINNMAKGRTERLNKWGLTCILFYCTVATIFFALNNFNSIGSISSRHRIVYEATFNSATKVGLTLLCLIAIAGFGAHILAKGRIALNKKNLIPCICSCAGLLLVGLLLGLLQNAGMGFSAEIQAVKGVREISVFGGYTPFVVNFESEASVIQHIALGGSEDGSAWDIYNIASVGAHLFMLVLVFLTFSSFGAQIRAVDGEKKVGLAKPIVVTVFAGLLLLCSYIATSAVVEFYIEMNGGEAAMAARKISVSGNYFVPVCIFLVSLGILASAIVRKVFLARESKQVEET